MSVFHRLRTPWRVAAGVLGLFSLALSAALPARAAAPHYPDILPISQVKPGMKGYGLTTFKGTTISRFEVTVIGILKKENEGHDLILIRMKGGPITERGANLIQGMSGSPIYLKGKVAGAFSMGEQFPKEPVGMVTPIEDMLDAWDPDIPQHPTYFQPAEKAAPQSARKPQTVGDAWRPDNRERVVTLPHPIDVDGRRLTRLVLNARADDPRRSTEDTAVLRRATTLLSVTGISERDRDWLQKELDKRGYALTVTAGAGGGGHSATFKGVPLRPGSAFGTFLATGDLEIGATGTVTYRRGNRILGFGHPLFGLGALEAAITSASIVDIFSGIRVSHHIAVPGPIVGTLTQDRDFSVSAVLGRKPDLIPFTVAIRDETTHRTKTFHTYLFQHPDLTPLLLRMIARDAVQQVHDVPGDVMARVTTSVDAAEVGRVTRSNLVFDADDISAPVTQDLTDITNIVSGNPFYPLPIKSARMAVDISDGHNTATVERIFLKQGRYEPGDNLDIGVVLKPYRREAVTRTVTLKLPSDIPTGRYPLIVRGGTASVLRIGGLTISGGPQETQAPPVNVRQMVARLNERETNTDLIARLVLNTVAPALEGEKLSQLPPNLSALMRSDRNSGVRLERDELRGTSPTDYVVSGTQQLLVTVVRKNTQEPSSSGSSGARPQNGVSSPQITLPGAPAGGVSAPDGDEDTDSDPADTANAHPTDLSGAAESLPLRERPDVARWLAARAGDSPADPPAKPNPTEKQDKKNGKRGGKAANKKEADTPASPAPAADSTSAPATTTNSDKPVGRQLQVWRQTARADFANGKFEGTSVTADGELRLTPTLHRLATTSETYIWSLAVDKQGNLYAGTGTDGKILKIDPQGKADTFVTLPVVSVQSLLLDRDGTLWAGSGVKGNLYRITPDGKTTLICALPEKYILALAEDSKGNLYLGPGGGGTIYKIARNVLAGSGPVTPEAYLKTPADHIMALTIDKKDNLYVGTGDDGILYRVTPDGKSSVLYDAKENSITTLLPDNHGNVYAGTGPKGIIYRVAPDGTAAIVYDRATSFFTAMQPAPDGTFYAATVNTIYHVTPTVQDDTPDATVQAFDNPKDVDFLSLAVLPNGGIATGTGNIGEVYTAAPEAGAQTPLTGTYVSVVHDTRLLSRWGTIRWDAALPAGGQVRVETRTGDVSEPDATWSPWTPVQPAAGRLTEGTIASPPGRFLQYRLTLEAGKGASETSGPAVREVAVGYLPRNQAPKVTLQAPAGGERWAGHQTIRWSASDPDNDTLVYDLYYSADAGANWTPLPSVSESTSPPPAKLPAKPGVPPASLEDFRKRLDAQPNLPPSLKAAMLAGYQRMISTHGAGGSLRDTSKSWDTKSLPDGVYQLKVVASDRLSNPTDALTDEAISDPFVLCNAQPTISVSTPQVMSTAKTVALEGSVTQPLIAVTAVQYRVDGGDWIAAASKDGLFDASQESFAFVTLPLTSGKHTIEVEAFNAAGAKATQKVDVTVP